MRARRTAFALAAITVAVLAALAPLVAAQGLGDVAAREKQKRRAQEPPKKVFTEDDLKAAAEPPTNAGSKAPAAGGNEAAGSSPAKDEGPSDPVERERRERALLEAEWRMRFANAREQVALADAAAWTEGYRIEVANGVPVRVRTRERIETEELTRARQALADLEEEFRRSGLPAGWARESQPLAGRWP
jgi:hypothetical protein